jgi:hypothetical protein
VRRCLVQAGVEERDRQTWLHWMRWEAACDMSDLGDMLILNGMGGLMEFREGWECG